MKTIILTLLVLNLIIQCQSESQSYSQNGKGSDGTSNNWRNKMKHPVPAFQPGQCPVFNSDWPCPPLFRFLNTSKWNCSVDSDCDPGVPCCQSPCGKHCISHAILKEVGEEMKKVLSTFAPGQCPTFNPSLTCPPEYKNNNFKKLNCKVDSDCKSRVRCCNTPCGLMCIPHPSLLSKSYELSYGTILNCKTILS
ncbi:whey acidic protein-like [Protopterus annectens]|uniref:whey acidic protein-like n=1 Tax=Protopterus annectens TaxID=7888 RepID=UPI001CFA6672|nr:whey acidic protein-like [Protopterus annectens]